MQARTVIKFVASTITSIGVGTVVGNAIEATTPKDLPKFGKALVWIGSFALGGLAGYESAKYVESVIDDFADAYDATKDAINDLSEEIANKSN